MKHPLAFLVVLYVLQGVVGPPVTQQKKKDGEKSSENEIGEGDSEHVSALGIEYDRYLKEVVTALESDPDFRRKLESAAEADIRSGKIAKELEFVNHNVRTKLDELKRQELERLRQLAKQDQNHLDHRNPHTFEVEDLKKLIAKITADLAEADRRRREEFKEYEMQKQFENEEKMKAMNEEKRHELEEELQKMKDKHKKHEPLHHPGSKQQLEEVWEKQDHMENQEFDPKTFFYLHDLDGNGAWDEEEVKTLFLKELDKLYQAGAPEDDMRERREEMERMREHVFKEADTNNDGLISYQEFLQQTQKPDFEKDEGWQGLDEQQIYSPEEYAAFKEHRQQQIEQMIQQGLIPPHPYDLPPPPLPAGHQQFQQPQHFPPGAQPVHPNQIPQGRPAQGQYHVGQVPSVQYHAGQASQAQYHPGQAIPGQFHPGQAAPAQFHPGQAAPGQFHPAQVAPGQFHGGQVPQPQYHPGQVRQGQFQGQVSQGQIPQYQQGHIPETQFHPGQQPTAAEHGEQMKQGQSNSAVVHDETKSVPPVQLPHSSLEAKQVPQNEPQHQKQLPMQQQQHHHHQQQQQQQQQPPPPQQQQQQPQQQPQPQQQQPPQQPPQQVPQDQSRHHAANSGSAPSLSPPK